jgi:nucleotide-binding universal stress UspA family protein
MNTILVPIDFSETSENALNYATSLANYLTANLILLHVDTIPVYNNEYELVTYTIKDSIETSLELLKEKALKIKKDKLLIGDITYYAEAGELETTISEFITKKSIDLIVMGITGQSTKIGQTLFGSNSIKISRESKIPVFIIPKNCSYKKIENIAYACQYDKDIKEQTGLIQVKNIIAMFNANLNVLHVVPNNHLINQSEAETDLYVEQKLENINHKTFILTENNVSKALLDFINTHQIDLIIIEQKKHTFFHKIFYPSSTKEVAFNSPIPVLTIHS